MPNPRKPNAVLVREGKQPRLGPAFGGIGAPRPPAWLPREAKSEWRRVVKACEDWPTWLQQVDRGVLTAYCMQWATFVEAAKVVAERGVLVPARVHDAPDGAMVKNPAVQVVRDATAQLRSLAAKLGFSPEDRGRVDVGALDQAAGDDPFDG